MKLRSIYLMLLVPLLGSILVAAVLRPYVFSPTHAASISGRIPLPNDADSYIRKSHLISRFDRKQAVAVAIGLNLRNEAGLTSYIQQITQPQSPLYHHYLNSATFNTLYAPPPESEAAIRAFLHSEGFKITTTYANHLMVDATGTAAQIEHAFQVHLNNYQTADKRLFYANDSAPSLPSNLAPLVTSVGGLDNIVRYGRKAPTPGVVKPKLAPSSTNAAILCPQPGQAKVPTVYTPPQIATAYDATRLYNAGNLGEGQTVGLLELDGFSSNDIALYASCFGGRDTAINTVLIDGYNGAVGSNALEVELDMEMLLGLAPRLAALRVYEAPMTSLATYNDAWARIVSDDVPVVSTSWVFCEEAPGLTNEIKQENTFFEVAAAQGQTILAASGDLGATGCYNPDTKTNTFPAVDDPASQPYVTGVGGTTLRINPDNTYASEQVWNDRTISNGASGGGLSHIWGIPKWQQGPGVANAYSTGFREVPDVSVNADPETGYDVYCSAGGCRNYGWQPVGGTSAAAPVWAAMVALANEASLKANQSAIGFLNPSLYAINHGAPGTSYTAAFHDVVPVSGGVNNNDYVGNNGTYPDAVMYDLATGLGSFDAYNLTQNLITLGQGMPTHPVPTSTKWYFAEGRAGGLFQEFLTLENPNTQNAQVQVQYLLEGGTGPKILHMVPPKSRVTVSVNNDLNYPYNGPGHSLSMIVTSNPVGIVAERPMYFSWHGINSGMDALGATQLGQDFYFADVESQRSFSSFITILNPPGNSTANVTVSYFASGKLLSSTTLPVPPGQRGTITPTILKGAAFVHSDQPVVVERPTYFITSRSNIAGPVTGATTVVGTPSPATNWLFAEGYTGPNFHEDLVLANFGPKSATATVKLEYSNGTVNPVNVTVPPRSQTTFNVNAASTAFASQSNFSISADVSAEVTSDNPIVAERVEYFRFGTAQIPGATDVIGLPGPAKASYSFAEGYTTNNFTEYLTLQNPNTTTEDVVVTLYMAHSNAFQQIVHVGPQSRMTLSINDWVNSIVRTKPAAGYEVSMSVQAVTGTIVAERPMYFSWHGVDQGGSDVVGYTG